MTLKYSIITLFLTGFASSMVQAEYTGPTSNQISSLQDILDNPKDEQFVRLKGYLVEKTGHDTYLFQEGDQTITVEIEQDDFPTEQFNETHLIEISGEVEKDFNKAPEIEVDTLIIIK